MIEEQKASLIHGDSREVLAKLDADRFDSVVTDPPYELTSAKRTAPPPHVNNPYGRHRVGVNGDSRPVGGFMGKEWDSTGIAFSVEFWREVLRVLKPGAHLLAFGGARNNHPTVKPVRLMRYLVRLITPPGGTVLDPFTGSGTTGMAARLEGLGFVGIEREAEYMEIARARIAGAT